MKVGVRKPSIKKSVKARTTGKAKRAVKKAVIPMYGKKGTGIYKDPKKAVYNKVYNKTTVGVNPLTGLGKSSNNHHQTSVPESRATKKNNIKPNKTVSILFLVISILTFLMSTVILSGGMILPGIFFLGFSVFEFYAYRLYK